MIDGTKKRYAAFVGGATSVILVMCIYSADLSSLSNFSVIQCPQVQQLSSSEVKEAAIDAEKREKLYPNTKIFAFIHTFPASHQTRAKAVEMTWATRLDDYVFLNNRR
ncbi:unnamed protein product, partial [Mesorhabditis belari]|uniref:Uncharacterized protein n=1 Tax=Mesorhabditis belari TaxID=2138241 RepID=A0AAF3JAF7_9BILA